MTAPSTALLRSPVFQGHDTGSHPENPLRLTAVEAELERLNLFDGRPDVPFGPAPSESLERIHDSRYLSLLAEAAAAGGGWLDGDTFVGPDSWDVARLAAGAALAATDAVLSGRVPQAFCLVRPPGHHAAPTRGMGFCLVNSVAVAAAHVLARGLDRVAIVDWDVHHGNGTQDAFYDTDRVLFCSVHQSPLYPGTGMADENGEGAGEGYTLNVPLRPGCDDHTYRRVFEERILPAVRAYRPELLLVSAGFDAHVADPLANMRVTEAGFAWMAGAVSDLADDTCHGRLVALLEGGYDLGALSRSVAATLRAFDGDRSLTHP
jgi:acetoin utilization deacetylase AcuC-like enzyme